MHQSTLDQLGIRPNHGIRYNRIDPNISLLTPQKRNNKHSETHKKKAQKSLLIAKSYLFQTTLGDTIVVSLSNSKETLDDESAAND